MAYKVDVGKINARIFNTHGNDLELIGDYNGAKENCLFECKKCGNQWYTKPQYVYLGGNGCPECANERVALSKKLSTREYKKKLKHKFKGNISCIEKHRGNFRKIKHHCLTHGYFHKTPDAILCSKYGCPKCGDSQKSNSRRYSHQQIKQKLKSINPDIKLISHYRGMLFSHKFRCKICYTRWETTVDSVLRLSGCPRCNNGHGYSNMAIKWIEQVSKELNLHDVRHADNIGEKTLYGASGKRYRVDGYSPSKEVVLEFHGDAFHGNPDIFDPISRPNPWNKLSSRRLYRKTKNKEDDLRDAGYEVISMWENDFVKQMTIE